CGQTCLGRLKAKGFDDCNTIITGQLRQNRAQACTIHFTIDFMGVITLGAAGKCTTTTTPKRGRGCTSTRTTSTLLAPWLAATVTNLTAVFLFAARSTCICLVCNYQLMHQGFVKFTPKHNIGSSDCRSSLTLIIQELEFPDQAPLLIAGRTPPVLSVCPGTAPRTSSKLRSASTRTISKFCIVRVTSPMCADIFWPGDTRPGS